MIGTIIASPASTLKSSVTGNSLTSNSDRSTSTKVVNSPSVAATVMVCSLGSDSKLLVNAATPAAVSEISPLSLSISNRSCSLNWMFSLMLYVTTSPASSSVAVTVPMTYSSVEFSL